DAERDANERSVAMPAPGLGELTGAVMRQLEVTAKVEDSPDREPLEHGVGGGEVREAIGAEDAAAADRAASLAFQPAEIAEIVGSFEGNPHARHARNLPRTPPDDQRMTRPQYTPHGRPAWTYPFPVFTMQTRRARIAVDRSASRRYTR